MISKTIKGWDMFGHVAKLNFDKESETHSTIIGGIFSGLIKVFFALYFFINFKKLIFFGDDTINFYPMEGSAGNGTQHGSNYIDLNMLIFWDVRKTRGKMQTDLDLEEMSRYVKFSLL